MIHWLLLNLKTASKDYSALQLQGGTDYKLFDETLRLLVVRGIRTGCPKNMTIFYAKSSNKHDYLLVYTEYAVSMQGVIDIIISWSIFGFNTGCFIKHDDY